MLDWLKMTIESIDKQDSPTFRIIMIIVMVMMASALIGMNKSISHIEIRVETIAKDKVAKEEFKQLEIRLNEIHRDIREIRNAQK